MDGILAVLVVATIISGPIPQLGYQKDDIYPKYRLEGQVENSMEECRDYFSLMRKTSAILPNHEIEFMACVEVTKEELQISQKEAEELMEKILSINPSKYNK